jgi:hypothetical protein
MKVGMVSDGWVRDADRVDGFDASQTPGPNVIVPLNTSGVLDLSATSALINVYTVRRIDGNNLTSDYPLAVGEEVIYIWDTTKSTSLPLHISTSGGIYQIIINGRYNTSQDISLNLAPNNTSYSNAFTFTEVYALDGSSSPGAYSGGGSYFLFERLGSGGLAFMLCSTYTDRKFLIAEERISRYSNGGINVLLSSRWNDTTTAWTSLGTLLIDAANGTFYVLVRRLV